MTAATIKSDSLKYRPDIDGLRALAVMGVVIYHSDIGNLFGGFVGVDIFFVISGYLIGKIVLDELDAGHFSLAQFYERRIRRIVPALFVMLLFVSIAASLFIYPRDMKDAAYSLIAAVFSAANIFFMFTTDYFGDEVSTKPLLHTWSLGVEEQFYIFFPLCMMAVQRWWPTKRTLFLLLFFFLSFAISAVMCFRDPVTAFYSPHTRAWELLAGVLLAVGLFKPIRHRLLANSLATAGLGLAVLPMFAYSKITPFPGIGALPPVLGAALIIYTGTGCKTWVSRLLSIPPAKFVGQISYSLYLWHWPIFKILLWPAADILTSTEAFPGLRPWMLRAGLVLLTFAVATISWRFIEQPFRKTSSIPRLGLFGATAAVSLALVLLASAAIATNGWNSRFSPQAQRLASFADYKRPEYRENVCFLTSTSHSNAYRPDICLKQVAGRPNYLLIGDSHAAHLWYGLSQSLDANVMQANASGCKPLLEQTLRSDEACGKLISWVYHDFLARMSPDLVILSARWQAADLAPLARTLDWLRARHQKVVVLGPIEQYQYALPYILAAAHEKHDPGMARRLEIKSFHAVDIAMASMLNEKHVPYGSVYNALCPDGTCTTLTPDGEPIQFDYSHLTAKGSLMVARSLVRSGVFAQAEYASGNH